MFQNPKWTVQLANMVNSVAINDDGSRVLCGTYYYPYKGTTNTDTSGTYGTYFFDGAGNQVWKDEFQGNEGIYTTAITGDGRFIAVGGLLKGGKNQPPPTVGLLRIYDAYGTRLFDWQGIGSRVNSIALSDDGATLVAVTNANLYVATRTANGYATSASAPFGPNTQTECVALHPDGSWCATCDTGGNVYMATILNGAVHGTFKWPAPVPANLTMNLVSVAISANGGYFAACGDGIVYLFSTGSMMQGTGPVAQYRPDGGATKSVRWVAISRDASLISIVMNQGPNAGAVLALSNNNGQLALLWKQPLDHNPNMTAMDAPARLIGVADGYPDDQPGCFYLFDAHGAPQGKFATNRMNWPIAICARGSAIATGSDNGNLYYFEP